MAKGSEREMRAAAAHHIKDVVAQFCGDVGDP
jgi:hypothetical protein